MVESIKAPTSVVVSAPANTMLMGEHAVLFGHSALVCALTQRIYVQAHNYTDEQDDQSSQIVIESKLGHFTCALSDLDTHLDAHSPLSFVLQALAMVHLTVGVRLVIESEFDHTLGLGSSAAVTVAVLGAMSLLTKGQVSIEEVMRLGIKVIRKVQSSGSGADVAASAMGGIVKFTAKPVSAVKVALCAKDFSKAPNLRLVYCGYKTATPVVIAYVAAAAKKQPKHFQQCYENMGACVETSVAALSHGQWPVFAQCMNEYQSLMRDIGVSDDITETIIGLGQNQARHQTSTHGISPYGAKISGSGLGDCVLLLGSEVIEWPHAQISVQIDPQGLRQEKSLPSQTQTEKVL